MESSCGEAQRLSNGPQRQTAWRSAATAAAAAACHDMMETEA